MWVVYFVVYMCNKMELALSPFKRNRAECRRAVKPDYKCRFHGSYRVYNDVLKHLKNWTLIWTTMAIIPLTVILFLIKVSFVCIFDTFSTCRCLCH